MSNSGKSPSSVLYPEIGLRAKQGSRLWSCVSLRHGSDAWRAAVSKITERLNRLQTGCK
jgi:hypothetical protein